MDIYTNENFLLTEKLRNEDPEQFYTLVRMHLSFVLDLNTDECDNNSEKKCKAIKWNLPFSKKQKTSTKNGSEGPILTTEFVAQMQPIIQFLSQEDNISQEGIFRRTGKVTRQQELKILLHQGAEINFNNGQFSVHDCASVLKNILSELPESILTDAHYPAYCQIAEICGVKNPANEERLLRSLQLLILLLPNENRKFFQDIIELLHLAVSHEDKNRMSADNLATLFTPHLLCPRRLSPEALHTNSQVMSCVVAFMIQKGSVLFQVPPTVATDVRAYWNKKEKRKLSPLKQMNESVCDGTAANTVFTFVDRERTAQENRTNPTETALAQLYAYIQSLPESSKKRKLIKQFNKENGYGTPLRASGGKKRTRTLNLGDSIKKHLSGFSKTNKRSTHQGTVGGDDDVTNVEPILSLKKVQNGDDEKLIKENALTLNQALQKNNSSRCGKKEPKTSKTGTLITSFDDDAVCSFRESFKLSTRYKSCETLDNRTKGGKEIDVSTNSNESNSRSQASSKRISKFTQKRSLPSPLKTSPCKSPRESDEYVKSNQLLCSPENEKQQNWPVSNLDAQTDFDFKYNLSSNISRSAQNLHVLNKESEVLKDKTPFTGRICKTPRNPINLFINEDFSESSFDNLLKTPMQKFNSANIGRTINNDCFLSSSNNTNRLPNLYGPKSSFLMTTSTPAPGNSCLLTPIVDKNNSMSPITKSTRRMPKAMQETMMTPRSRKPVISLSGTDLCNLANADVLGGGDDSFSLKSKIPNGLGKKLIMEDSNEDVANDSLSSTFRNYLFSRSVLTASPVDLSFSSRTDDFLSLSEKNSSEENENFKSLPEILNEAGLSESLLYCLNGNEPDSDSEENEGDAKLANCSYSSFSDCDEDSHHVYETAL